MNLALATLAVLALSTPNSSPGNIGSHEVFLREVRSAEARALQNALDAYDAHLREHPADAVAAVEQCKLIAAAMAAREDREDPVGTDEPEGPSHSDCLSRLEQRFPDSALALSYRIDLAWGKEATDLAAQALSNPRVAWTDAERAHVHARLSRVHSFSHEPQQAAREARLAMTLDPSLDLTRELATGLLAEGRRSEAIVALSARTSGPAWELQQKARMLADAGALRRAHWMIELARAGPNFYPDRMLEARILEGVGKIQQARQIYAGQEKGWNRAEVLTRLFKLDLAGSDRDSITRSYQELRNLGWKFDPVGRYRLALLRKVPGARWYARDLLGVLGLLGGILVVALLPGLFLLPLHHWALWRRLRKGQEQLAAPWSFRSAWMALGAMLVLQLLATYFFNYDELASWITPPQKAERPPALAAFVLSYAVSLAIVLGVLVLLKKDRLRLLGPGSWSLPRTIRKALLGLFLVFVTGAINKALFHGSPIVPGAFRVEELVRAMVGTYGVWISLFAMAVLIPVAEELLFRSVLLDLLAGQFPFWLSNVVQALLFGALHVDPPQFLFYVVFGLLAGWLRHASGGLLPSILMHAANNAIVILALAAGVSSRGTAPTKQMATRPDKELIQCAAALGPSPFRPPPEALERNPSSVVLNNVAWSLAIEPGTSPACLVKAEEAVDAALRERPETPGILDTKATVLFRQQRLDEAIDLERAASDIATRPAHFSQLDRFLRRRRAGADPIFIGRGPPSLKLALEPGDRGGGKSIYVEPGGNFEEGVVFYAHIAASGELGLLKVALGPRHQASYRLSVPKEMIDLPADARLDVALVDGRGCDDCAPGTWRWAIYKHDPSVDAYP